MKQRKKGTSIVALLMCFILVLSLPGIGLAVEPDPNAYDPHLSYITFVNYTDESFLIGETRNLSVKVFDQKDKSFSKSVFAYIIDSNGNRINYSVSGTGIVTISNLAFDELREYELYLEDASGYYDSITIKVIKPNLSISGKLATNSKSEVTVQLTGIYGNAIPKKQVTVDGTGVGANSSSYTTNFDGSFTFTMTPSSLGTVKFLIGGHEIGQMEVSKAYTQDLRIGRYASDSASLSTELSVQGWNNSKFAILTRDDVVADAMVAVPLSKKFDAPILMTPPDSLDGKVLGEMKRLTVQTALIMGGTGAISQAVEDSLKANGMTTVRFAGTDRYDTAAQIAAWIGISDTVYLAYGYGEPDALAASSFAASKGIPILLTDTNELPEATQARLEVMKPSEIVILGGTGIISPYLENSLRGGYSVKRWGGQDRYATQQIIFQNLFNKQSPLYFVSSLVAPTDVPSGKPYGDALLAAALAAKKNGFIVCLPQQNLPTAINYFLLYNKGYITNGTVVGNYMSISKNLEQQLQVLLDH